MALPHLRLLSRLSTTASSSSSLLPPASRILFPKTSLLFCRHDQSTNPPFNIASSSPFATIAHHRLSRSDQKQTNSMASSKEAATHGGSTYHHPKDQHHETESLEGPLNEWKHRAPYLNPSPDFKPLYHAKCHCGKVKYSLSRKEPLDAKICHCTTCQRLHGAPFQWCAIFHKEDIRFEDGVHDLGWYESSEKTCVHKLPCKVSCAYCRTPIMDEGRNMILIFPTLVEFQSQEEKERFRAKCHMFYPQRVIDIDDDLPKWSGIKDNSELLDPGKGKFKVEPPKDKKDKQNGEVNGDGKKGEKRKRDDKDEK